MEWYYILLIISAIILLLFSLDFVISYFLCKFMIEPYCPPLNEVWEKEYKTRNIKLVMKVKTYSESHHASVGSWSLNFINFMANLFLFMALNLVKEKSEPTLMSVA